MNLCRRHRCFVCSDAKRIRHLSTRVVTGIPSDWTTAVMMQVMTHPLFWAGRLRVLTFCLPGDRRDAITAARTPSPVSQDQIFFFLFFSTTKSLSVMKKKQWTLVFWDSDVFFYHHYSYIRPLISCAGPAKRPERIHWGACSLCRILITTLILMTYFHAYRLDAN